MLSKKSNQGIETEKGVKKNKYGGINDMPKGWAARKNKENLRIYQLWMSMLNRCNSGRFPTYSDCKICDEWMNLSNFAKDIKTLSGYEKWEREEQKRISLDKDLLSGEQKIYSPETCCFITASENSKERSKRIDARPIAYPCQIERDGVVMTFNSQTDACKHIGVTDGALHQAIKYGRRCGGYTVKRLYGGHHLKKPRERTACSICGEPAKGLGYCNKHYFRFKKYGNPLWVHGKEENIV